MTRRHGRVVSMGQPQLRVRWMVVPGDAGNELRAAQLDVIREVVQWWRVQRR